jgi:hypothetical protein
LPYVWIRPTLYIFTTLLAVTQVMKYYSPAGRRNHGRSLKRFQDTWDRNGWTSGPTPWKIYDDDDDEYILAVVFLTCCTCDQSWKQYQNMHDWCYLHYWSYRATCVVYISAVIYFCVLQECESFGLCKSSSNLLRIFFPIPLFHNEIYLWVFCCASIF